jgi:hypothetical protein
MPPPSEIEQNDFRYNSLRGIFFVCKAIQLDVKSITARTAITIKELSDLKINTRKYPINRSWISIRETA